MTNDTSVKYKKHDMVLSRVFDAPIEEVWKAWSDSLPGVMSDQ
jgi:uncharacterized protein YndB with AHSA1/START domain